MRDRHGISIIMADSGDEVDSIIHLLGITEAFPLRSLEQMFQLDPDAVYFVVMRTKEEMTKFAEDFTVKRGVMSVGGHRSSLGFNVDWMSKILLKPRTQPSPSVAAVVEKALPKAFTAIEIPPHIEKDDPYADLGYRR